MGPQSLNLLDGPVHLHLKRLMGDAFSEEAVDALLPQLKECAQQFCQRCGFAARWEKDSCSVLALLTGLACVTADVMARSQSHAAVKLE